jgi:hypothetical protein
MAAEIQYEEWLAELARLGELSAPTGAGLTTQAIACRTGWSVEKVRKHLALAAAEGRLVRTRVNEPNVAGYSSPKTAYRILPAAGKGKKK